MHFQEFPKIPRLNREIIITEKIDGTNAQIYIADRDYFVSERLQNNALAAVNSSYAMFDAEKETAGAILHQDFIIRAGSRNRWLTEKEDNYGFWKFVKENAADLSSLGNGRHFGEWWGKGIQRGYGLDSRRFSLFNTARWNPQNPGRPSCCGTVPVLTSKTEWTSVPEVLEQLRKEGSVASPGFKPAEGIVVWHKASQSYYKVTLEGDEMSKGEMIALNKLA